MISCESLRGGGCGNDGSTVGEGMVVEGNN